MAVTVSSPKNSLNGKSFIELLGFAAEAKALADKGWQFKLTAKNLVMEKGPYKFEKGLTVEFLQACRRRRREHVRIRRVHEVAPDTARPGVGDRAG